MARPKKARLKPKTKPARNRKFLAVKKIKIKPKKIKIKKNIKKRNKARKTVGTAGKSVRKKINPSKKSSRAKKTKKAVLIRAKKTAVKNDSGTAVPAADDVGKKLERLLHQTIKKVTEDIESLRFNTAVSALMILLNEIEKERAAVSPETTAIFLKLLAPFAPHLAEELWQGARKKSGPFASIHTEEWPRYSHALIREDSFELVVQVNGKVRDSFTVPANISEMEAKKLTLERESVKIYLSGREPKRVIFLTKPN